MIFQIIWDSFTIGKELIKASNAIRIYLSRTQHLEKQKADEQKGD
jgi:hypothetical protein